MTEVPQVEVGDLPTDPSPGAADGIVLLDVREDEEWQAGHAPGAIHVPLGQIPSRLAELPEGAELHVVCRTGGRSQQAATWLSRNGYDAVNVAGGMTAWAAAGRPMVADGDAEPFVR